MTAALELAGTSAVDAFQLEGTGELGEVGPRLLVHAGPLVDAPRIELATSVNSAHARVAAISSALPAAVSR